MLLPMLLSADARLPRHAATLLLLLLPPLLPAVLLLPYRYIYACYYADA